MGKAKVEESIIDTNVILVANRQNENASKACEDACVKYLIGCRTSAVILLDRGGLVRAEYAGALKMGRPYQIGSQFLIYLIQNSYNPSKVRLISLDVESDGEFSDFPRDQRLVKFDRSDRKFAALSRKEGASVANAIDSDWLEFRAPLLENGVTVRFLCGCDDRAWFVKQGGRRGR